MLVIKPDECIDCGVCEPECPIEAIEPDSNENANKWIEMNKKYSEAWPNITKKRTGDVPADENKWRDIKDKLKVVVLGSNSFSGADFIDLFLPRGHNSSITVN